MTVSSEPGWYDGRATFFGASKQLQDSFEKIRGPGSYGDLHYGSCGYFDKPQVGERWRMVVVWGGRRGAMPRWSRCRPPRATGAAPDA